MRIFTIILIVLLFNVNNLSAQFSYIDSLVLLNQVLENEDQSRAKEITKDIENEIKKSENPSNKYDAIIKLGINELGQTQGLAYLIHKKGVFLYKQKKYKLALITFKKALNLRDNYSLDKATSLYMIGVTLEKIGSLEQESIDYYQNALDEYILLKDTTRQIRCSHRIGVQYFELNELDLAEKNLRKALNLQNKNTDRYARINIDLSAVFHKLKKYKSAEKCLLKSIDFFLNNNKDSLLLNNCYNNIGNVYDGQEKYDKALEVYYKSLEFLAYTDILEKGRSSLNIGETYLNLGKLEEAEEWLKRGLELKKSSIGFNLHPEYNSCLHNLGVCYMEKGEYLKALEYFQLAISSIVPDFKSENIYNLPKNYKSTIGDYQALLDDLSFKGKTFNEWYKESNNEKHLEAAYQSFKEFSKVMELMQNEFATESSRLFWLDKYYPDIEIALNVSHQRYEQTKKEEYLDFIFYTIEQNKAIVLLESLRKRVAYKPKDYAVYKSRENTLVDYKTSLIQSSDSVEKDSLIELIRNLEIKQEEWKIEQKENSPFVNSLVPTIEETQANLLSSSKALINYFVGDSSIFCLVVTKDKTVVHQFSKGNLQEEIKSLRTTLENPPTLADNAEDNFRNYAGNAWKLGEHIINPILKKLPKEINELIILSDGELNFIPFSVLLAKQAENEKSFSKETPYLMQEYSISYGYSSAVLLEYKNKEKTPKFAHQFAAFAPHFDSSKPMGLRRTCSDVLSNLIHNKDEADEITNIFSKNNVAEKNNTKSYFMERVKNTRIIHLATHACINENATEESRIFLEDDPLFLHELYAMDNQAEMVVLSACETGLGELKKGEGVMSLSRAFAYSGVPSTTMSLWSVNDESTKNLMVGYYKELESITTKHIALANAQKGYLAEVNDKIKYHPYYWAAFVHYGDTVPVFSNTFNYWFVGLAVLFMIFGFWYFRNRKA